jgi:hypothetical protein
MVPVKSRFVPEKFETALLENASRSLVLRHSKCADLPKANIFKALP